MKHKIIFLDFQYEKFGSFDDDFLFIESLLKNDYSLTYRRFPNNALLYNALTLIRTVFTIKDKVVVLSCKTSLTCLIPLIFPFSQRYYIYHFMPFYRQKLHLKLLKLLSKFFSIGVYSTALQSQLGDHYGLNLSYVPSRFLDKNVSLSLLKSKVENPEICVFIPGIKKGVRRSIDIDYYISELEKVLKKSISKIFIQSKTIFASDPRIIYLDKVDSGMYRSLFNQCLFTIIEFEESYEQRFSGVVHDAIKSGSIILTKDHPILSQYGFPNSIVTNIEKLPSILKHLYLCNYNDESLIFGLNRNECGVIWKSFLN